jgi:hypothetical protein
MYSSLLHFFLCVKKKKISGAGTAYPSGAHEITPVFNGILIIP